MANDRYSGDVLAAGWQRPGRPKPAAEVPLLVGLVLEDPGSGFVGAVVRWEHGNLLLEDRRGATRAFPLTHRFLLDGEPVVVGRPAAVASPFAEGSARTPSGSRISNDKAKVALPSRIYVEGRHDAELVEKVWGDDLRHVGVVVEYLGGIDDLPQLVAEFAPARGRRLGVLVDHLVTGTKETRIVEAVARSGFGDYVFVTGHAFIDIWEAVRPQRLGIAAWPKIPRGQDWKKGVCAALGWPHDEQADIARAWRHILGNVRTFQDLEPGLPTEIELLIDFVTQDHPQG